jgi:hypothetical protein
MSRSESAILLRLTETVDKRLNWLRDNYLDQPAEIAIETQAVCNAACTFCPYPTLERIGTKMPTEMLYALVDQTRDWKPFFFTPFKVNEPLLDKRLYPLLRYVNKHVPQATVRIFTNGSPLTLDWAEKLHNIDNLELYISLNSHRKAEYEPLMDLNFDRTIKNIDALHASDFRHPVNILKVGRDIPFAQYVLDRWPYFEPLLIKRDAWLGFTNSDNLEVPDHGCARWFELSIMATGKAALCCMDSTGEHGLGGDVTKQTLLEVYNMPVWRERREQMLNRKLVPTCQGCTY